MGDVLVRFPGDIGKGRTDVGMTWCDTLIGPRTNSRVVDDLSDLRLLSLVKDRSRDDQSVLIRLIEGLPKLLEKGTRGVLLIGISPLLGEDRMDESWGKLSMDAEVFDLAGEGGRENFTLRSSVSSSSSSPSSSSTSSSPVRG